MAQAYLALHREELMPDAIASITEWALRGDFGKRVQRALCSKLNTNAQTQEPCCDNEISVQISGAK
jgi:hypothetical protein